MDRGDIRKNITYSYQMKMIMFIVETCHVVMSQILLLRKFRLYFLDAGLSLFRQALRKPLRLNVDRTGLTYYRASSMF